MNNTLNLTVDFQNVKQVQENFKKLTDEVSDLREKNIKLHIELSKLHDDLDEAYLSKSSSENAAEVIQLMFEGEHELVEKLQKELSRQKQLTDRFYLLLADNPNTKLKADEILIDVYGKETI